MPTETITSKDNAGLKAARAARDGRDRGRIFVEGVRLAEEALRSPIDLLEAYCDSEFGESSRERGLTRELEGRGIAIARCSTAAFRSIADTSSSQGIVLIARRPANMAVGRDLSLVVYLHEISDPSNLGAVLRTAEAAGVDRVLISPGSADPFSPKALRASMGSAFRVSISERAGLERSAAEWRALGITAIGASADGETEYFTYDWARPTAIVMGSEAHGLPEQFVESLDSTVSIPMKNGVESLNLAVSTGILLFEAKRQRSL